jgi:hypothetical protein
MALGGGRDKPYCSRGACAHVLGVPRPPPCVACRRIDGCHAHHPRLEPLKRQCEASPMLAKVLCARCTMHGLGCQTSRSGNASPFLLPLALSFKDCLELWQMRCNGKI